MPFFEFNLNNHSRSRAWVDCHSPVPSSGQLHKIYEAETFDKAMRRTSRSVTVELSLPTGGYSVYGLLGGTLCPTPSGFRVDLSKVRQTGPCFNDALGTVHAHMGLAEEFSAAATKGLMSALLEKAPSAVVLCDVAACCDVGSNNRIFETLGWLVGEALLFAGDLEANSLNDLIATAVDKYLSKQ